MYWYKINISLILRKHYPQRDHSRRRPKISENLGPKTSNNLCIFVEKVPHLRFFIQNFCPQNFRKFRTNKHLQVPKISGNFGQKSKTLDLLWFASRVGFHVAGLYVQHFGRAHGWCLWLVPNFPNFCGQKSCQANPKKNCRRVRTLALEAIGLELDFRLCRALLLARLPVSGG